jgi:hypothetical protein
VITGKDGTDVAFLLSLPSAGTTDRAVVISGIERAEGEVEREREVVRVRFPIFHAALVMRPSGSSGYTGSFESTSPTWGAVTMPLVATPVAGPSLALLATITDGPPVDLGEPRTFWRLKIDGSTLRLVLDQVAPSEFNATVYFDNGNVAYLGGNGHASHLVLGGFEGAAPFSLDLRLDPTKQRVVAGIWRAGYALDWKESTTGERTADFVLAPKIELVEPDAPIALPGLEGLEAKPLIIELAATWCSTCKVAAQVLRDLYRDHHAEGLEIVSLLFEFSSDPEVNRKAVELFVRYHHIPWKVVAVPGAVDKIADLLPKGVENIDPGGFPAVLFRHRNGRIAGVYSGFPAESTGAPHEEAVRAYRRLTETIMAR